MRSVIDGDSDLFPEYAKRFVLAAWDASREIGSGRTADLRGHQRRLFSLLTAMMQARTRRAAPFSEIDRGLRRLATQAIRFAMCDPDNLRKARLFAQALGERSFPLLHRFDGGPDRLLGARATADGTIIRIDFRARQRR